MTRIADRYQKLKAEEAALKAELATALSQVNKALDAGQRVVSSDGTEYVRRTQERRKYTVSGRGGIMALLRKYTELDVSSLLSVSAAGVKKLPGELQEQLTFVTNEVPQVVEKR